MAFCSQCGSGMTEGANFCSGCGSKVSDIGVAHAASSETSGVADVAENRKKVENAIQDVKSALTRIDNQAAQLKVQSEILGEQAKLALAQGNEDRAREAYMRIRAIAAQLADLERQRSLIENQLQKLEDFARKYEDRKPHKWRR